MKIQCHVCEAAEATVLCCADEAALCGICDEEVHAANKLAEKHQRVSLSGSSSTVLPRCDICQEAAGFFFCLEDRALLCRNCDVTIHSANSHVSAHQRFLVTGIKVGLAPSEPPASSSSANKTPSCDKTQETKSLKTVPKMQTRQIPRAHDRHNEVTPEAANGVGSRFAMTKMAFSPNGGNNISQWQLDEIFGLPDFYSGYGYIDNNGSSKDSGKFGGDSDSSSMMRSAREELENNECLGNELLETSWAVPEIPSPPTASGLNWSKRPQNDIGLDTSVFVPDISSSAPQDSVSFQNSRRVKRRIRWF